MHQHLVLQPLHCTALIASYTVEECRVDAPKGRVDALRGAELTLLRGELTLLRGLSLHNQGAELTH